MNREELLHILVNANEFKEGDLLVGGTRDEEERNEARSMLASLQLREIGRTAPVDDLVSEALVRSVDPELSGEISSLTVGDVKRALLSPEGAEWAGRYRDGLSSEQIAAVVKLMTNDELSAVCRTLFNPLPGKGIAIGSSGHLGSRIQPNSPGDDEEEILFSILEGLAYGCGDVILGVNPASDDLDAIVRLEETLQLVKRRLELPTRCCVLSDILKQSAARERTHVEVGFQSLGGTSKALFGMAGVDIDGLLDLARGFGGLYFETGQGSAVTNLAAEGVDMVTLEARNYGLARLIRRETRAWTIVNDVAGFIGPEVFRSPDQLRRACLEDAAMAKLHGLTMGLDVCSTYHMGIDPPTLRRLTEEIVRMAAPAYLMAVAGNSDPMLGYMTTSFREHPRLRRLARKGISSAMQERLEELGVMNGSGDLAPARPQTESLYALFRKAGGDGRSLGALQEEGGRKLALLRERGFDLGYGCGEEFATPKNVESRMNAVYEHARKALYVTIDSATLRDASARNLKVRTMASDREEYLSRPASGETIRPEDALRVKRLYTDSRTPLVQIVVSDGLNADAINENLRALLPAVKGILAGSDIHAGEADIVVENGRVRAGYHVGEILGVDAVVHLIGERPGTGLNTVSAYLTYGRNASGGLRWARSMDHSNTTAICGIHRLGKAPALAAEEIAAGVKRILETKRSGVELGRTRA